MAEITECTAEDRDEFWQDTPQDATGATETSEDQERAGGQVMDEQITERAVEAAAKADYEVLRRGHWDEQPDDFRDEWRSDVRPLVTAALAEVKTSLAAERDDLAARIARVEALHQPTTRTYYHAIVTECSHCTGRAYPCPTIKALWIELWGESE